MKHKMSNKKIENALVGLPVPKKLKSSMEAHFNQSYKNGVNPNIGSPKLDVKWDLISQYVDFPSLVNQTSIGVALFYVLDTSIDYFSYVITKAEKVFSAGKWRINPIPLKDGYLMFTPEAYKIIAHSDLNIYKNHYKDTVKVRQWPNGNFLPVKSLTNHPEVSFFEGGKFFSFIENNINLAGITTDYDFTVYNGAINFINITDIDDNSYSCDLQTPLIVIENRNIPGIDDSFDVNFPYRNKALDVGRLCPPECD